MQLVLRPKPHLWRAVRVSNFKLFASNGSLEVCIKFCVSENLLLAIKSIAPTVTDPSAPSWTRPAPRLPWRECWHFVPPHRLLVSGRASPQGPPSASTLTHFRDGKGGVQELIGLRPVFLKGDRRRQVVGLVGDGQKFYLAQSL